MQQNYKKDSHGIGKEFEDFVENNIFTKDRYALIHRTSSKEDNEKRYPESASNPDFHFRCLETGKEFYVEAKYRSSAINNKVEGLKPKQELRFKKLNQNIPVFVIIGYWGPPSNPSKLSFLKLEDCKYRYLFTYYLRNFEIDKVTYPNHRLKLKPQSNSSQQENFQKEQPQEEKKRAENIKGIKKYNSKALFGLAAVGLLAIIMTIYSFSFSNETSVKSPEEQLKEVVADYYHSMNSNQIEKLPEFLSPQVTSWYGAKNPAREEIYRNARTHRGKYPYSSSDIDWESFTVIPEEAGGYHVTYEMIYRSKEKITDDYTVYDLKMITKWDGNFKLRGITEIRN
ncbi:hypothetical protein FHG64_02630 [Antarcticibacterium flavum]|uniref:Uncharacterized protein n=1 Tax=Antarcticibacterium flavum TaxID=2058175 RepID=A0A5B7WYT3_9FLAO|nr:MULTISPECIES: hypothetical protein [Antarcticibacterium]MCM4161730.1 hypothetical protein [Antarcticibacterium sp. W02-3]QCY68374.1 hypothetical protein FHG64_02630 [Antarcticibacterium flavum]